MGTNISRERRQNAPPPVSAPSAKTAEAVWVLVKPFLEADLAALCSRGSDRTAAELTAKQALVGVLDEAVVAGRDRHRWTINRAFDAVAKIWSPTFRQSGVQKSRDMLEDTVKAARRELAAAGVNFDNLWLKVLRDGLPGVYRTRVVGGHDHARGRSVTLASRRERAAYEDLLAAEHATGKGYRRPAEPRRLLLARRHSPTTRVARRVAGEAQYNVAEIGEKS